MGADITVSRKFRQRHTVTGSRHDCDMSLGNRIKDRLKELDKDAKWLAKRAKIPVSTMYEIINGRMRGSSRLPAIAAALGMHGMWLLDEIGPRLVIEAQKPQPPDDEWPLTGVDRNRIGNLQPRDIEMIVASVNGMLNAIDMRHTAQSTKKASR